MKSLTFSGNFDALYLTSTKDHNEMSLLSGRNGEITSEPLKVVAADDPVSCAIYTRENDLLNKPGWKRFKYIAK
jgi:hypothetical protein